MPKRSTLTQFIDKAKKVHGNKFDYSLVKYVNSRTKVQILCLEHDAFEQVPNSHVSGCGCAKCGRDVAASLHTKSQQSFVDEANKVHQNQYDYSQTCYEHSQTYVTIVCTVHGPFRQAPSNHLSGYGCSKCGNILRTEAKKLNTSIIVERALKIHGNKYDYSLVQYINNTTKIKIICPHHGVFHQGPYEHAVQEHNCPSCRPPHYSRKAIDWIKSIMRNQTINIQHAENGGEYSVPQTRFVVDGYHKETNTIYEFYGDKWHGNPNQFQPADKCHPYDNQLTAEELYNNTLLRENKLKGLGYNMITKWESEYVC